MTSVLPAGPATTSEFSRRLRADVALYATRAGHVLLVGDTHHHVDLDNGEVEVLFDALVDGNRPASGRARAALDALADAGLVDVTPAHVTVTGDGVLAAALRSSLDRMGVSPGPGGASVLAVDRELPATLPVATRACWVSGHRLMLSPTGVSAPQVEARRRAATLHRNTDPDLTRRDNGRDVRSAVSPLTGPGLELAAAQIAAELLGNERSPYEAVVIDLVALTVSRHPVLPVPTAPR